ncbi:ParA family protein [Marinicellulosiphila megalodicopiae]|uniref:ParA family protein n=1 Tax=Marinicellulosiphila megalodicopiae TaxID=2724896 RepID=UPI003BB09BAD
MRIWSVANQKGGVGKTTSVVNLGGMLAQQGNKVLIIDLDPQGSLTCYFKMDPDHIAHSSYNLFMNAKKLNISLIKQSILATPISGMSIMPASTSLATLERNISQQDGMGLVISKALTQLWDEFDYVLIDTPPVLGLLMINSLAACQQLLVPVQTEFLAIKGLERMVHTLKMVAQSLHKKMDYIVVPTMFDRRTNASTSSLRSLKNTYQNNLWDSAIPVDTSLRDASALGVCVNQINPDSKGARAYRKLLETLKEGVLSHAS